MTATWAAIPYEQWQETCSALHLYLQIAGKYRLAHTPWQNHSWHATFYVNARGLTTGLIPDASGTEVQFDLIDHQVRIAAVDGRSSSFAMREGTVAGFLRQFSQAVAAVGGEPKISSLPSELPDPIAFSEDLRQRPYDRDAVNRYFRALVSVDAVFKAFRTGFLGKCSPVHLFWGGLDLAVTRFSGRYAPLHGGNVPGLSDAVVQEAYDHECASVGFWPGGGASEAMFYAYAYPTLQGFDKTPVQPAQAYWSSELREFLLPYEAVRVAQDPGQILTSFLESTYSGAADLAKWPREDLDCRPGQLAHPRAVRRQ
ncbi:MAG TPA: DUF5996 family protein [Devosia sp.]|jgi:hypothetical protein|nr:DUF5996 family protein [Devosia sp.]